VGTPGRLCDLATRGALELSAVEALVLDEADEMLDLGFKDDLEKLLAATPTERRTLLFSATIPREIESLARTYTRSPLRIDARTSRAGAAHEDITYRAHLVRGVDRFAALVNVLVAAGDAKAIVFGRTREGVSALHQRLVDHGFRVVSMAGDRAQTERDRALDALREGRARVLVATNVAARGLDLPDVELVVHADLPDSAEDLTHRSGRTGRAGRKGTSVVFAEPINRRKAERLFMNARLPLRWSPAPSQDEAQGAVVEGLVRDLVDAAQEPGRDVAEGVVGESPAPPRGSGDQIFAAVVDRLRAALPERVLLPLLLRRELATRPRALPVDQLAPNARDLGPRGGARERPASLRGGRGAPAPVLFRINVGGADGAEPRLLLPLICRRGGVTRHSVGAIRVNARNATFEIAAEDADAFARAAARSDPRDPDVRIERAPSR
jgi:ATP-dependent RNA helicase DeaD